MSTLRKVMGVPATILLGTYASAFFQAYWVQLLVPGLQALGVHGKLGTLVAMTAHTMLGSLIVAAFLALVLCLVLGIRTWQVGVLVGGGVMALEVAMLVPINLSVYPLAQLCAETVGLLGGTAALMVMVARARDGRVGALPE